MCLAHDVRKSNLIYVDEIMSLLQFNILSEESDQQLCYPVLVYVHNTYIYPYGELQLQIILTLNHKWEKNAITL